MGGTTMSAGVMASAQGLLEGSSIATALPDLLSLLRSRILFGSPRTARVLVSPDELEPEFDSVWPLELTLDVSMCSAPGGSGDRGRAPGTIRGLSTQPAGVGGTGPNVEIGAGRRVGGETTGSTPSGRDKLCDLELDCGGGPGGGGGNGIPGSHLDVEELREREPGPVGVPIALAETARLEAGGLCSATMTGNASVVASKLSGGGLCEDDGWSLISIDPRGLDDDGWSLLISIDPRCLDDSGTSGVVGLRWKTFPRWLSSGCALSLDLVRDVGGGGGKAAAGTSGDGLYAAPPGLLRFSGDAETAESSGENPVAGLWLRGGE